VWPPRCWAHRRAAGAGISKVEDLKGRKVAAVVGGRRPYLRHPRAHAEGLRLRSPEGHADRDGDGAARTW
jgi:hypothetical protein